MSKFKMVSKSRTVGSMYFRQEKKWHRAPASKFRKLEEPNHHCEYQVIAAVLIALALDPVLEIISDNTYLEVE